MLKMLRMRQIGLSILLLTVPLGLFGCVQALDSELTRVEDEDNEVDLSAQGLKEDNELLGQDREAAVQQALGDWRVQGIRSILESEGKVMELDKVQAFSFHRGSHEGTLVLLPFGESLLSFIRFKDKSHIMLTAHQPAAGFRVITRPQERKKILDELQAQWAFQTLEEELKKRDRRLVPGLTLLLKDDSQGEVIFFIFTRARQARSSGVLAQILLLDDSVDAGGTFSTSDSTTTMFKLDPGLGGGPFVPASFAIRGITTVKGFVNPPEFPYFEGTHITLANIPEANVTVEGHLGTGQDVPTGSAEPDCSDEGKGSASCSTFFQAHVCADMSAVGESEHAGEYQNVWRRATSSASAFVKCPP